jgi:EmrB/QacA subfamily drug resistance transporter
MAGLSTVVDSLLRPDFNDQPDVTEASSRRRTWTLVVACGGVALVIASMIALNAALGDIAAATSATQTQLTWVVDGYTLALACLLLPGGAIGDRYGRRKALLTGLAIFTVASVAPVFLDSPVQIIVSRAVAGAGAAFVMPATLSLLTVVYPKDQRTKAVGIWAGVAGTAALIGLLVPGALLHVWEWKAIFWSLAAAGVVLFALTLTVAESREPDAPPVDWPGAALIGTAVAAFVFGIMEAPTHGWTAPLVIVCLAAGFVLAALFCFVEMRRARPLLDMRLFRRPEFTTGALAVTIFFFANFGFFYLIMQFCQEVMGYSALHTALSLAPLFVPILILCVLSFWYLPKLGLRLVLFVGLLLVAAGIFFMRLLEPGSTYLEFAWPITVMALGIGLCTASATSAIMNAAPDEKQGVASAVNDTTREIGAALGIAVAGSVLAANYTNALRPNLSSFPEPLREPASHSLAEAIKVSEHLGPQGNQFAELAKAAFVDAMHSSLLALALSIAIGAVLVGLWAPGRDGRQLRIVRKLSKRSSSARDDEPGGAVGEHDDRRVRASAGDRG